MGQPRRVLDDLIQRQCGVLSRQQVIACGLTADHLRTQVRSGRWQRLFRSTYATFSGPPPRDGVLWAAVLCAGPRAVLGHQSAAEVSGLVDEPSEPVHVTVPPDRRVVSVPGLMVHHSIRLESARHPTRLPPQTRIEETVVDLTQTSVTLEQALNWVAGRPAPVPGGLHRSRPPMIMKDSGCYVTQILHDHGGKPGAGRGRKG
jgi:hypothetical protein